MVSARSTAALRTDLEQRPRRPAGSGVLLATLVEDARSRRARAAGGSVSRSASAESTGGDQCLRNRTTASFSAGTTSRATSAREQLIEQYLPLVRSLARRYAYRGEQLEDLVQVGCDRADQGDRPLRRRPRRRADDVRDAEHHRRDQAALPRQGLGDPRAARPAGAERAALAPHRGADRPARALADDRRAREGGRRRGGGGARGARERPGVRDALALRAVGGDDDDDLDPLESLGELEHEYEV